MLRKILLLGLALGLVAGMAAIASAALTSTNHNMILHDGLSDANSQQGACSFCHVPHGAKGSKLFGASVDFSSVTNDWGGDSVAIICFYCHGGAGAFSDAINVNPFEAPATGAHGRSIDSLVAWGDIAAASDLNAIYGTSQGSSSMWIGCQSCHNPHDNATRPFLRNNNSVGSVALVEGNYGSFCEDCHQTRDENDGSGTYINHPTDVVLQDASNANLYAYTAAGWSNKFNSTWASLTPEVTSAATADDDQHWNLGGKFLQGSSGTINCGTCHMVHGNELSELLYTVTDGLAAGVEVATASTYVYNALAVLSTEPSGSSIAVAAVCTGCHDIASDANAGPGAVGTYSHAYASTGWNAALITAPSTLTTNYGAKWGDDGSTDVIVCQSCHDMHYARLADDATNDYVMMRITCDECHAGANLQTQHHPTDVWVEYGVDLREGASTSPPYVGASITWQNVSTADVDGNVTSGDVTLVAGNVEYYFESDTGTEGRIVCGTCHNNGAHNGPTAGMLTGSMNEDQMCVDCHGFNPSYFTNVGGTATSTLGNAGNASHYLGSIGTANYKWLYGDGTAVTPASGGTAVYAADGSGNGELICTSCHTVKTVSNGATSSSDNDVDNENSTETSIRLLLTPSGNRTVDDTATADFLCSACHGATPGGGGTHPLSNISGMGDMSTTIGYRAGDANNGITYANADNTTSATGQIQCESCHRPHNASTNSGTKILEHTGAQTAYVNSEPMCNLCHSK